MIKQTCLRKWKTKKNSFQRLTLALSIYEINFVFFQEIIRQTYSHKVTTFLSPPILNWIGLKDQLQNYCLLVFSVGVLEVPRIYFSSLSLPYEVICFFSVFLSQGSRLFIEWKLLTFCTMTWLLTYVCMDPCAYRHLLLTCQTKSDILHLKSNLSSFIFVFEAWQILLSGYLWFLSNHIDV